MNLFKKCTAKPYHFWVKYTAVFPANPLRIRCNLLEKIQKLFKEIGDMIRDGKLHYNIDREITKISAWSSGKTDKYEYLGRAEILSSHQIRMIWQAKFTYSFSGKPFQKKIQSN